MRLSGNRIGETLTRGRVAGASIVHMTGSTQFTADEARAIGEQIGIDWATAPFDVEQFRSGMDVELEHGQRDAATDVTGSDPVVTGKIALAHLNEFPDYYTRLAVMEAEAPGRVSPARSSTSG